jgi:membrane-anchored glycerophosphoryl diester phosphodiesterase (GDPDase)
MQSMMMSQRKGEVRWEWIGEAWKLFTANPGAWIGMLLLYVIATFLIIGLPVMFILIPAGVFASNSDPTTIATAVAAAAGVLLFLIPVIMIVALFAVAYLFSGMFRAAIKQSRGQQISVGDLFSGGDCFLRVLGLLVLSALVQIAVWIVFLIPSFLIDGLESLASLGSSAAGLIVNGLLYFSIPLIVDRGAGVMDAIRQSIETTKPQWWMFALFALVVGILCSVGVLACGIGVLVTLPFYFTVPAVAYRDTFGAQSAQTFDQFSTPPPPSYYAPQPQFSVPPQPQFLTPPEPTPLHSQETQLIGKACPTCGATITRAANFCNQCGGPLQ